MRVPSVTLAIVVVLLTLAAASASIAGPLYWLSKAERIAGKAAPKVASVARLSRAQVLALGSTLGAGTVVLEARGGRLLLEAPDLGVAGLDGALDDLGQLTNRLRSLLPDSKCQYLISAESADELGTRLDILLESGTVYIAEPGVNAALVATRRLVGAQWRYFKELRPNVLVPLETPITTEAAEALAVPLQRGNLTVISAFGRDDVDAVQKLATAAGDSVRRFAVSPRWLPVGRRLDDDDDACKDAKQVMVTATAPALFPISRHRGPLLLPEMTAARSYMTRQTSTGVDAFSSHSSDPFGPQTETRRYRS